MFSINWGEHRWALFFCAVSILGHFVMDTTRLYYTGVLGMKRFVLITAQPTIATGNIALTTTFISLTSSIIYVGEPHVSALGRCSDQRTFSVERAFLCVFACIIEDQLFKFADQGSMGVIVSSNPYRSRLANFTVTCLLYIGEVAPQAIRSPALMMFQFMQSCSQLVGSGITQGTESNLLDCLI